MAAPKRDADIPAAGTIGMFVKSGSFVRVLDHDGRMLEVERLDTRKRMSIPSGSLAQPGDSRLDGDTEARLMTAIGDAAYVSFNEVVHGNGIDGQVQYLSRCLYPREGETFLAEGLRVRGERGDYHGWTVHRDDVDELVSRFRRHSSDSGMRF